MPRPNETPEERNTRLQKAREAYRLQIHEWAKTLDLLAQWDVEDGMSSDEALALRIAAHVLRDARAAVVKRAQTKVRQEDRKVRT